MADDKDGEWMPLVKVIHRGESPSDRWALEQIMLGRYRMRWTDDHDVQREGRILEHVWRLGYNDTVAHDVALFGLLSFEGRTYQGIEILLPLKDVKPTPPWSKTKTKPSGDEFSAVWKALEAEYGEGAHPSDKEVLARMEVLLPTASRDRVLAAKRSSRLRGERGRRSNI
jgi:hypothetical protein